MMSVVFLACIQEAQKVREHTLEILLTGDGMSAEIESNKKFSEKTTAYRLVRHAQYSRWSLAFGA